MEKQKKFLAQLLQVLDSWELEEGKEFSIDCDIFAAYYWELVSETILPTFEEITELDEKLGENYRGTARTGGEFLEELLEDIGDLPKNEVFDYLTIDWEKSWERSFRFDFEEVPDLEYDQKHFFWVS